MGRSRPPENCSDAIAYCQSDEPSSGEDLFCSGSMVQDTPLIGFLPFNVSGRGCQVVVPNFAVIWVNSSWGPDQMLSFCSNRRRCQIVSIRRYVFCGTRQTQTRRPPMALPCLSLTSSRSRSCSTFSCFLGVCCSWPTHPLCDHGRVQSVAEARLRVRLRQHGVFRWLHLRG